MLGVAGHLEDLHDVGSADQRSARHATRDDLREARQVGGDTIELLCAARAEPKSGDDFVEDQQNVASLGDFAQSAQEVRWKRHPAPGCTRRLDDHGGNIVLIGEKVINAVEVIGR